MNYFKTDRMHGEVKACKSVLIAWELFLVRAYKHISNTHRNRDRAPRVRETTVKNFDMQNWDHVRCC